MRPSLCETCAQMREVHTPRGSRFLLCKLGLTDPAYAKYPPQPVLRCEGYRPMGGSESEVSGGSGGEDRSNG